MENNMEFTFFVLKYQVIAIEFVIYALLYEG